MSLDAYQRTQTKTESPQETEYRLFTEVTRALMAANDRGEKDKDFFDALDWNRRMWSVFSTDCGVPGNGLPDQLRASVISLSIWVSKHSSLVARGQEEMEPLIDINRTVMEGLANQIQLQKSQAQSTRAPAQTAGYGGTSRNDDQPTNQAPSAPRLISEA